MRLILIDGNSLMYRAYHATANNNLMQTKSGDYTNAIFAFANMLAAIMSKRFDGILIAFDKGKITFRHEINKDYKSGRAPMPDELRTQIPNLKEYIDILGIKQYELDLYEADDIIGTMAKNAKNEGYTVDIYSSDRDLLQLVDDNVTVHLTKKGMTVLEDYNKEKIFEHYGLTHKQLIDLKALMGDSSDNLKGIVGVGEKTAVKLLQEYETLENVLEHAEDIPGKLGEKIRNGIEDAKICKKMVTINTCSPIEITLEDTTYNGYDERALKEFYTRMEFHSFLKKMESRNVVSEVGTKKESPNSVSIIDKKNDVKDISIEFNYKILKVDANILVDNTSLIVEVDDMNYHKGNIIGFGISNDKGSFFLTVEEALSSFTFSDFLADGKIRKNIFDYKKAIVALNRIGMTINGVVFDGLLASYVANPLIGKEEFKVIASAYGIDDLSYDENIYGKNYKSIPEEQIYQKHIAKKAFILSKIKPLILDELNRNEQMPLFELELPLARVIADMEIQGMLVDTKELNNQKTVLGNKIFGTEQTIFDLVGKEFNIASPKQLGEILFDYLRLPVVKKTKTGYSTDIDVLEKLVNDHPVIPYIIEYRSLTKLYSTYIEGLNNVIHKDGKVHTIFKQALTQTGRLSSIEPNLQNIPIRTKEGKQIRKIFVPSNDYFLSADYSQIELRVLAHMANEEALIKAFKNNEDIHESTARSIFNISVPTKEDRQRAKAVNFGVIYGISAWGLSEDVHISPSEAKRFIEKYFATFPGIKSFMDRTLEFAGEKGYVLTIMNRRRYIPEMKSGVYMQREYGKRTAMNAPIQGSAADIIKKAMLDIYNELKSRKLKSKLVLQVHDELIIDCVSEELEIVKKLVKDIMENTITLLVPLKIEYDYGDNWYNVK